MKKILTFLTLAFVSFGLLAFDAEAKRMGGGKNVGTQRSVNQQQATPNQQHTPAAAPAAATPPSTGSKWGGALAGLAAGGLLAALFMGGAFENINMTDILVLLALAAAVFFIIRMLRKPRAEEAPAMQYSGMNTNTQQGSFDTAPPFTPAAEPTDQSTTHRPSIPADFQVEPFLRHAKASFIRLQTAHDHGNIEEIRDYTTPEMLAEISAQIKEHGSLQQKTEVMFIDAHLLEVETTDDLAIASVRFTGQLRDAPNSEPEAFDEIWHVQKDLKDPQATWLLAGIQQVS